MTTSTSLVTGVDFVTVPTKDYEAAAERTDGCCLREYIGASKPPTRDLDDGNVPRTFASRP